MKTKIIIRRPKVRRKFPRQIEKTHGSRRGDKGYRRAKDKAEFRKELR